MLVALIADTHGLIRPEALAACDGADLILHAGDVGGATVLAALQSVAPTSAVYGNTDSLDFGLAAAIDVVLEGVRIHVSHGHEVGSPTPERLLDRYEADVIVYGHTHRPLVKRVGAVLIVNPGAAGPRRFNILPSLALLTLPERNVRLIELWDNLPKKEH